MLRSLDANIGRIYDALPPNCLMVVATGHGDTAECGRLQELKFRRQQGLDGLPRWSQDAEEQFNDFVSDVLRGLCFAAVKR